MNRTIKSFLLLLVVAIALPPYAFAADATSPQKPEEQQAQAGNLIQMNFDNIELRDLIRFVSNIMGKNFVFDDAVVKGKATILSPKSLSKDEVFRVFEAVLNYYGFAIVASPEAMKVVRSADAKGMAIDSLSEGKLSNMPSEDKLATYVYQLEYLDSNTMVGLFRPMMSKDAYLVSIPATNSLIMIDTASNLQRVKNLLSDIDIPTSKQLSSIKIYNVQHTNAGDLAKVLQTLLAEGKKAQTPKEKIFITSYASTNSLFVSAPAEDMKEIERIINEIDTLRPQVLVESAIVEMTVTKGEEFGVEWLTGAGINGGDTGVIGGGFIQKGGALVPATTAVIKRTTDAAAAAASALNTGLNVAVVADSWTYKGQKFPTVGAFVRALSSESGVNILSTPQIMTMNNEEAEIIVGQNRPYLTSTRVDSAGNPLNTYDYRDVGIKLKVKPYINKDGFVNLNLYQEVTGLSESDTATTGATLPTTFKRSTKTTVGVRDGQTIVISGLIRDDSATKREGIPLLSKIPILGYLFGYNKKTSEKTNLLVFITPKIVYAPEQVDKITKEKRQLQEQMGDNSKKQDRQGPDGSKNGNKPD